MAAQIGRWPPTGKKVISSQNLKLGQTGGTGDVREHRGRLKRSVTDRLRIAVSL